MKNDDFRDFSWLNEPPSWSIDGDGISVVTGSKTDFWRKTFYGFINDNGHFFSRPVSGDFTAIATFTGEYRHLYDQAGLMIRADENNWAKTGIEYTDGSMHMSAVLTRDLSDWSVVPLASASATRTVRMTRHAEAIRIDFLDDRGNWQLLRLGNLILPEICNVGIMTCSPLREGFRVVFNGFQLLPPVSRELH
ncbi:MAG: DUF1349 domain-containing protein [Spirochaetales bacterium]|nr:DUF1349 domain-containing protein [Spirochaetales bacterium]